MVSRSTAKLVDCQKALTRGHTDHFNIIFEGYDGGGGLTYGSDGALILINEITVRRARLILGWVTVGGGYTTSVFNQPIRPTQPSTLSLTENVYRPKCAAAGEQWQVWFILLVDKRLDAR